MPAPSEPLPRLAYPYEARRECDLSAYGTPVHTYSDGIYTGAMRVLVHCSVGALGETLRLTPLDGGWSRAEIVKRRLGRTSVSPLVVQVRGLPPVAAPQFGQVWRRNWGGGNVALLPAPDPAHFAHFRMFDLATRRWNHNSHQIELLDCGYTRVQELPRSVTP